MPEKILDEARHNLELRRRAESEGRAFAPVRVRRRELRHQVGEKVGEEVVEMR